MFQTYYRGEVNVDQKTPDGNTYNRYEFPHIFGSRVRRGDEELGQSKFPTMLGMIEDESDGGCYSQQSSVVSQWEDRIVGGDEGVATTEVLNQTAKTEEFNFHDMSKEIPENLRMQPTNASPKMVEKVPDRVFNFSENEDSPFMHVKETKRNEKNGSPKVRRNIVQLEAINGHPRLGHSPAKPTSWAVAAGGIENADSVVGDTEEVITEQTFYPMKSPDPSQLNDPNLECDKLHETPDNNVFETLCEETDFKKCSSNGWDESKDSIVKPGEELVKNKSCENLLCEKDGDKTGSPRSINEVNDDDFSFDPAIKEINNTNAFIEIPKRCETENVVEILNTDHFKSTEFLFKSFANDNVENNTPSVGPVWILPPDEGQKKRSKKKKKRIQV